MYLCNYNENNMKKVNNFKISNEQLKFTKSPIENVNKAIHDQDRHCILGMTDQNEIATFFVLHKNSEYRDYFKTQSNKTLLLRSLSTDNRLLKQGYAKQSLILLDKFIKKTFPDIESIALVVNKPNKIAYNLYLSLGFIDMNTEIKKKNVTQLLMQKALCDNY